MKGGFLLRREVAQCVSKPVRTIVEREVLRFFFYVGHFKSLFEFVTILLLFYVLAFWP